jgi:aldose 1-epimerase
MGSEAMVSLSAGNLRLELSPSIGGAISALDWSDDGASREILRKCNNGLKNVLDSACFPLVPYVNRIRGGQFGFRGREVRLAPNMAGDPSPLHGQGWLNPWEVEGSTAASATLSYHHQPGEWPWTYEARQEFVLDARGLSARLSCRNRSEGPMPCGLGFHPYFRCGPETRLETRVTHVWTIDEQVLPVDRVQATGRYDLENRKACGQDLDNGFVGWAGEARMSDPDWPFELVMSSPDADFFQLYSPAQGGIFVAEPVTHANAALNAPEEEWPALGLRVLDPGQAMSVEMRLEVLPK